MDSASILMAISAIALAAGGWSFRQLLVSVKELTVGVQELRTEVAVLSVSQDRVADHEARIRVLELK